MALPINETTMKIVPSAKLINFIKTYICRDPLHSESIRDFVYDMSKINEKPVEVQNFSSYQQKPNEKKIMGKESLTFKTAYLKERSNNLNDRELQVFGFEVLVLNDLKWLQRVVTQLRKQNNELPYLHELIRDCKIALPKNEIIERNPELEARCIKLRCEQEAKEYKAMTRNVDNIQNYIPQDSIAYQRILLYLSRLYDWKNASLWTLTRSLPQSEETFSVGNSVARFSFCLFQIFEKMTWQRWLERQQFQQTDANYWKVVKEKTLGLTGEDIGKQNSFKIWLRNYLQLADKFFDLWSDSFLLRIQTILKDTFAGKINVLAE
ncbi:uncharacterized protein LOC129718952 isoform X1 [Wyeomyia smithii]|uniref:uncharacterized protein LOC129718952 isoform X1 n=1 Tax=Wyeomyia smithii TaxID=174621 RepID=UPI002467E13D|nr:uncharacterized protein LOC129718952 isoform X1 [Wyeomyia smithii]XP_055526182.1 uncharacterized protein LOC129718952 isoform X1 [Wyeomyia smithii]